MKNNENYNTETVHSNLAIPPGEFLEEVLEDLGMSKEELAQRIERPASKLSAIFKGEKAITPETALRLEKAVGVPAHIWSGLEAEYRLTLARLEEEQQQVRLKSEEKLVPKYCYKELVKLNEVEKRTKPSDKLQELLRFFGTTSLTTIPTLQRYQPAFRLGHVGEESPEALTAWIRVGERRAALVECDPFNKNCLKSRLSDFRRLTLLSPSQFMPRLIEQLAECGVALVVCPHFPKTKAHGATFKLREDKVVLMMTIRGSWADMFWFSFFHELGHIIHHSLREIILDNSKLDGREKEADQFASDLLIPPKHYQPFVDKKQFTQASVKGFAHQIDIHPGIVVGRLQHDGHLEKNRLNRLRELYQWEQ